MMWNTLGIWIQVFLTLAVFSFLYKDNPFYKFAEHLFVGIATGYWVVLQIRNVLLPNLFEPLFLHFKDPYLLIPLFLGLVLFTRLVDKYSYLSRWGMAAVVGIFAGLAIFGFGGGDLIIQIRSNILPFIDKAALNAFQSNPGVFSFLNLLTNPIFIIGVICVLFYFFFSKEHTGTLGVMSKIGIYLLMISFGASYGNTVMARISLFIDRAQFGIKNWIPTVIIGGLMIIAFIILSVREKGNSPGSASEI